MTKRSRNKALKITITLCILLVVGWIALQIILNWATRQAIDYLAASLAKDGIELQHPDYKSVGFSAINAVTVRKFYAFFRMTQHNVFQIERNFEFTLDKLTFSVEDLFKKKFMFTLKDGTIMLQPEYGKSYSKGGVKKDDRDKFIIKEMKIRLVFDFMQWDKALKEVQAMTKGVAQFAKQGKTTLPVTFKGLTVFVVRDKQVSARLYVDKEADETVLLMDKDDYRVMCKEIGERLTEAELDLYAHNPLRIPRLTKIRNYSSDKGREAEKKFKLSQDTVKHVFWAYLLTQSYDEKFSEKITDAHEIGVIGREELAVRDYLKMETGGQIQDGMKKKEEAEQDLINNLVGRDYAKKNYEEATLVDRMQKDERVVWHWSEVEEKKKKLDIKIKIPTVPGGELAQTGPALPYGKPPAPAPTPAAPRQVP